MLIGELARRSGVSARSLRYYEQHGLLSARRDANGYRMYDEEDVRLAREIGTLLTRGFSLAETRPFVECLRAGYAAGDACPESVAVYRRKLAELDACIDDLQATRDRVAARLEARLATRLEARLETRTAADPACEFTRESQ
jgi:DNA-binding transcriptional MerR regulator